MSGVPVAGPSPPTVAGAGASRLPGWDTRLHELIAANMDRPHEPGQWDCLLFPAASVEAVTGADHGSAHRGKYRSIAGAYRHLQRMGFESSEALLDNLFDEKPIGFAQRGDLVLCRTPTGDNPGVCMGDFALVVGADGERDGLVRVSRADWLKAWAVGEHHSGKLRKPRKRRR